MISVKNLSLRKSKTFGHFFTPRGCEGQIRSSHGNWLREQLMRFIVLDRIRVWKMTLCSVHVVFSSFAEVAVLIVVVFVIMCLVVVLLFFFILLASFFFNFCFFPASFCFLCVSPSYSFLYVFVLAMPCILHYYVLRVGLCWVVPPCHQRKVPQTSVLIAKPQKIISYSYDPKYQL